MSHKQDHLYLMHLFIAIVKSGSFAAAARQMNVAPTKVSKDIQFLEKALNTILLNRSTRSLNMTDSGEVYFQSALEIVEMHSQMLDNLSILKNNISGELRITAPTLWGEIVLAPIIIAFKQRFPLVKFSVDLSNENIDIYKENIHIAFRSIELSDEPYIARYITIDDFVLCATPKYLENNNPIKTPKDLTEHQLITLFKRHSQFDCIEFEYKNQTILQHVKGELLFNNKKVIYETVKAGLGIAVLPKYLVEANLNSGELSVVLKDYEIKSGIFYALFTQRRRESALVNQFIDFVIESVSLVNKSE